MFSLQWSNLDDTVKSSPSSRLFARVSIYILVKDTEDCKISTYLSLEHFRYFRAFEFLQVKSDARALREALGLQFQLDSCKHEVMIAAHVGTWERSFVCFVDAGLEALGCQDKVSLVVNLPFSETVTSFEYLGSFITDEDSKLEILSRIAQTTAALARLKPVWNDRSISRSSKICLMRSLVTSIFLHACESCTLTRELQRRIQAMEMRCYRKTLRISYEDRVTNEEVRAKI